MASKKPRWYLDSCLFISHLNGEKIVEPELGIPRDTIVEAIFSKAMDDKVELVTSAYTIVEVNGGKLLSGDQVLRQKVNTLFQRSFLDLVEVDRTVAERARSLIWQARRDGYALDNDDMVHLATALTENCQALLTWDRRHLMAVDGIYGMAIHLPEPGQLPLPGIA